uniref:Putative glutathione s-transferase n=1 Tax=Amblyomma aureolatum TaxID=187763 RepID=A0A1E1XBE0_9ACAR
MPIVLYNLVGSPPCGFIRALAKEIGVELSIKNLDFQKKEHLSEDFLKINPFHKVPAIDDDGFVVYESNAIAYSLLRKYAPESELYPACVRGRTRIDQVLASASCNIHIHLGNFFRPRFMAQLKPTDEEVSAFEENVFKGLENLIGDKKFAVGDKIPLADLCLIGHVTLTIECGYVDKSKFPKLTGYYDRVKAELACFDEIYAPTISAMKELLAKLK